MNLLFFVAETAMAQTSVGSQSADKGVSALSGIFDLFSRIFLIIGIFVVAMLIAKLIAYKVIEKIRKNQKDEEHSAMIVLARRLIYITLGIIAIAIGLGVTDMFGELGWLLGAIGIGIGFAFQSIIGNFVAGLTLLIQQKIRIGDMIGIDGYMGIITNVGSRAVTIHDLMDGTDILIPNLEFFNKYVRLYTANPYRRVWVEIGVGYDTDFAKAYEKIFEILKRYPEVEQEPPPDVLCDKIKESTVNILIRWWIKSNTRWWSVRSNILKDVFVELQEVGVDISFPVQTLRIDSHESDALFDFVKKEAPRYYEGPGIRKSNYKK